MGWLPICHAVLSFPKPPCKPQEVGPRLGSVLDGCAFQIYDTHTLVSTALLLPHKAAGAQSLTNPDSIQPQAVQPVLPHCKAPLMI
eukprot:1156831-Pelagomonas_calceolata.AAC.5